ncbi:MAG TPA: penicillin acylase family protein [Thermoanaerobaculia bacterium]|nr:penicillin acylase family protein [Thermoanaerobaculia bacterium]
MRPTRSLRLPAFLFAAASLTSLLATAPPLAAVDATDLASQVVIHRDEWGVPHVYGKTDAAVAFGSAWSQCEDHFWQLEDTYIQALGRYAEIVGEPGLESDIEVAAFELVESARSGFATLDPEIQRIAEGFAAGYDFYLEKHPDTKPRLLTRMEPWHVLLFERFTILGRLLGAAHVPNRRELSGLAAEQAASVGSNQWAVGPSKTRDGSTMLFINPHQPWYGWGMFTEMHVKSDQGLDFSGAMYPGGPLPTAGFNRRLGWAYTVNEADISDVYRLTFDHPTDRLLYRYGDGWRRADEWTVTLSVRDAATRKLAPRRFTLRKSHYGPVMAREDPTHWLAVRVPKLHSASRLSQALAQAKARNFAEWHAAASRLDLQTLNTAYADADGNIYYLYNGAIAKRDPTVDWTKPVDGGDPRFEWNGFHTIDELPQVLNPASGYVQNCNSSPFTTTDDGNPSPLDFPVYMAEDRFDDKRRAKMSRYLLRGSHDLTFDDWQALAYDTTLYWPMTELPRYARLLDELTATRPELAAAARPYLDHLVGWDYRSSLTSTQATLAVEWYEELYGRGYPVETLKPEYVADLAARFEALVRAAKRLETLYGSWKVPYGDVYRMQRHAEQAEAAKVPFDDARPSLPTAGVRGPLGVAFTLYHTPPVTDAAVPAMPRKLHYGTTGASYMAVIEFRRDGVKAASYLHYGQSHDPTSPHFFDQAKLLSERRFKPAWLAWDDVVAHTVVSYHPGEAPARK